ncbi:MAG: hypothetical protein JXR30_01630 [Alphaproteobacteria bacterium]|nr:hypothetical protein [Alphaproteobacteria bacterium]
MALSETGDYVILESKMGRWEVSEGFEAYRIDDKFYVPLGEVVRGLEFPIQVDVETGQAKGFFISNDREFSLDLEKKEVRTNTQTISLDSEDILWGDEGIYVESGLLDKFFPLETKVNPLDLSLQMKALEKMPFEERVEREKRHKMLESSRKEKPQFTDPFIENIAWFTFPFLDLSISGDHTQKPDGQETYTTYSLSGNGILFGLDSSFNFSGSSAMDTKNARFKVSRFMPVSQIKYFEAGDVSGYNMSLISGSSFGRGFNLSTFDEKSNAMESHFDLTGLLAQGWEVELYQNNVLQDFSRGDGTGQYRFDDIPLNLGMNKLKLVYYGEQGESREEEQTVYLSATSVDAGELGFRLYAQEKSMPLIPLENQKVTGKEFGLYSEYGVTQGLSLTGGLVLFKPTEETSEKNIFDETMGMLGLRTGFSIFRVAVSGAYSENTDTPALDSTLEMSLGSYNLNLQHSKFNGLKSAKAFLDEEFVESISRANIRGRLPIPFVGSLPFLTRYIEGRNKEKDFYREVSNMVSLSWWKFYLSLENKYKKRFSGIRENIGISNLNFRTGRYSIRGTGRYDLMENYLQSTSLGLDFQTKQKLLLQSNWMRSNSIEGDVVDSYSLSLSKRFSFGTLSAGVSTNTEDIQTFKISYNASILNNPSTGEVYLDEPGQSQKSAFSAKSYLDQDYDDKLSVGDEPLENMRYKSSGTRKLESEDETYVFMTGAMPYQLSSLEIDTDSLDDISYYPKEKNISVLPRTGTVTPVVFPIYELGEIDGDVMMKGAEGKIYPLSGIQIILMKEDKEVDKKITDSDGYYTFNKLKPGEYKIIIDQTQADLLGYKKNEPLVFKIDKEDLYETLETLKVERDDQKKLEKTE